MRSKANITGLGSLAVSPNYEVRPNRLITFSFYFKEVLSTNFINLIILRASSAVMTSV